MLRAIPEIVVVIQPHLAQRYDGWIVPKFRHGVKISRGNRVSLMRMKARGGSNRLWVSFRQGDRRAGVRKINADRDDLIHTRLG